MDTKLSHSWLPLSRKLHRVVPMCSDMSLVSGVLVRLEWCAKACKAQQLASVAVTCAADTASGCTLFQMLQRCSYISITLLNLHSSPKPHHCRSSLYSASSSWTVFRRLASFRMALLSAESFAEAWRSSRRLNTLLQHD